MSSDMPIITTKHNILDILKRPEDFIDEYSDTEIMTLPDYEAAIALQRLASINGWTVVHNEESGINELFKANGDLVTDEELRAGAEKLIEYYYVQDWDGKLPDTYVGSEDVSTIITGKTGN